MNHRAAGLIACFVLLWGLTSCSPQNSPTPVSAPAPQAPSQAVVDYLTGTAAAQVDGTWKDLDIGSTVPQGATVKTGPASVCELHLGSFATVRLGSDTIVKWEALSLGDQKRRSQVQVIAGQVLNKVSKLLEGDSYVVRTAVAAMGVRGTQFLVKVLGGASALAVKEGTVAVLPPSFDPAGWTAKAGDQADKAAGLEKALLEASQGVTAGQKTDLAAADFAAGDSALQAVASALPADNSAFVDAYRKASAPRTVKPLEPQDQLELKPLDTMPLGDAVPVALVQTPPPANAPAPTPTPQGPKTRSITLSPGTAVGSVLAVPGGLVVFDGESTLKAFGVDGRLLWSAPVPSVSNASTAPVFEGGEVVWTGDSQVTSYDFKTGKNRLSIPLDSLTSGIAAKRAQPVGGQLFLGASDGVAVFDRATGSALTTLAFAEGTDMTPAVVGGQVIVVGRAGTVYGFDPAKPQPTLTVATGANQPAAMAPVVDGDRLWFADRKGLVVAVSRSSAAVLWKVNVGSAVFDQPSYSSGGLYLWAQSKLYALAADTGAALFAPVEGLSAPPLAWAGRVYLSLGGQIRVLDGKTGKDVWSSRVPANTVVAPVVLGGEVAFALQDGEVFLVDPKTIP